MTAAPIKRQTSSGGVLFRRDPDGLHVALIRRTTPDGRVIWCLPKGWIEPSETQEAAALREVQEETGMQGKIIQKLGEISYWFYDRAESVRIHKTVHFFLMEYLTGDLTQHDREVEEVRWFKTEQVESILSYPTEKDIVQKALKVLAT
jgi:8-oxo-dGTP pyrophosphatase MutT (NUDIX family)